MFRRAVSAQPPSLPPERRSRPLEQVRWPADGGRRRSRRSSSESDPGPVTATDSRGPPLHFAYAGTIGKPQAVVEWHSQASASKPIRHLDSYARFSEGIGAPFPTQFQSHRVPAMDWQFPYRSTRVPILAANCVATTQPLAAQAGLAMLRQGGNAVDAAVATAIALTVVEPVMNGIGGDAFAIVWDGGKLHGLNASGRAPAGWNPERFASYSEMPTVGWETVTVPGAVSAWAALHGRFGRLPFEALFEPAILYARDGFLVSPRVAMIWETQVERLRAQPGFAETFLPNGRAPLAGEVFRCPVQAETLEPDRGEQGRVVLSRPPRRSDRRRCEPCRGRPVAQRPRRAFARLGRAARRRFQGIPHSRAAAQRAGHRGVDCARHPRPLRPRRPRPRRHRAPASRDRGDEARHRRRRRACRRSGRDADRGQGTACARLPRAARPARQPEQGCCPSRRTAARARDHLPQRRRCERHDGLLIQSNFRGFGSGVVVSGTGIALHNRGSGFSLKPGHANQVGPRKRPFHTIIPGFASRNGRPVVAFGVMGGTMQPQGHLQIATRLLPRGRTRRPRSTRRAGGSRARH